MTTVREEPSLLLFSDRLDFAMARAGMSQSQLAKASGTSSQTIRAMRNRGSREYSGEYLGRLASALQVTKAWLGVNDGTPPEGVFTQPPAAAEAEPDSASQFSLRGLTALQVAGLEALAKLMRAGSYSDTDVIGLLNSLKPRLEVVESRSVGRVGGAEL